MTGAGYWPAWPARLPTAPRVISDFRVIGDQEDLFGLVGSVPTAWRTLAEIAGGGDRPLGRITAAVKRRPAAGLGRGRRPARRAARHPRRGQDARWRDLHPARR